MRRFCNVFQRIFIVGLLEIEMYLRHLDPQPVELVTRATLQMSPLPGDDDDDTGVRLNLLLPKCLSRMTEQLWPPRLAKVREASVLPTGEGKEGLRTLYTKIITSIYIEQALAPIQAVS